MSVLRSAYSFDIIVTKDAQGNLFFDKRDDFLFDFLTVNENSNEPPADEAEPAMNSLEHLHREHTTTNQNFSQQVLLKVYQKTFLSFHRFFLLFVCYDIDYFIAFFYFLFLHIHNFRFFSFFFF